MKFLKKIRLVIFNIIDWFYQPFEPFVPLETFRYGVVGGFNTALDIFLYFICFHFVVLEQNVDLGFVVISPHIASFLMVFPVTFTTGFFLSKYITFTSSELHGRVQLFRYGVTVAVCILLNYVFLKLFVETCGFYPTPSKILTTVFVTIFSYFSQKHFTFRTAGSKEQ
jgi:putative flippase GtrA